MERLVYLFRSELSFDKLVENLRHVLLAHVQTIRSCIVNGHVIGEGATARVYAASTVTVEKRTRLSLIDRWSLWFSAQSLCFPCAAGWRGWILDLLIQAYLAAQLKKFTSLHIFSLATKFSYCSLTHEMRQIQPRFHTTLARYLDAYQEETISDATFEEILDKTRVMHNVGVIHHDLKADNWLVDTEIREQQRVITKLVISDFDKASLRLPTGGRFYNRQFSLISRWQWLQRAHMVAPNNNHQQTYRWHALWAPLTKLSWRAAQPMLMHYWSCQDPVFAQSHDIYLILLSILLSNAGWRRYPRWWLFLWPSEIESQRLWEATPHPLAPRVSTRQIVQWLCEHEATCRILFHTAK